MNKTNRCWYTVAILPVKEKFFSYTNACKTPPVAGILTVEIEFDFICTAQVNTSGRRSKRKKHDVVLYSFLTALREEKRNNASRTSIIMPCSTKNNGTKVIVFKQSLILSSQISKQKLQNSEEIFQITKDFPQIWPKHVM